MFHCPLVDITFLPGLGCGRNVSCLDFAVFDSVLVHFLGDTTCHFSMAHASIGSCSGASCRIDGHPMVRGCGSGRVATVLVPHQLLGPVVHSAVLRSIPSRHSGARGS